MNKKRIGFMADDTIDQTHVDKSHMGDVLNNLDNAVTSDATNLTNLTRNTPSWSNNSRWH